HRRWARHGLQVAPRPPQDRTGPPRWPGLDVDPPAVPDGVLTHRHLSTTPRSDVTSVREAYDNGWLVEVAEHAAEDRLRVTVKDNIDVAGMRGRNGTPGAPWRMPATPSHAWHRLERHGAAGSGQAALPGVARRVITP